MALWCAVVCTTRPIYARWQRYCACRLSRPRDKSVETMKFSGSPEIWDVEYYYIIVLLLTSNKMMTDFVQTSLWGTKGRRRAGRGLFLRQTTICRCSSSCNCAFADPIENTSRALLSILCQPTSLLNGLSVHIVLPMCGSRIIKLMQNNLSSSSSVGLHASHLNFHCQPRRPLP